VFKRLPDSTPRIAFTVDGRRVEARKGDTIAVAMLAAGIQSCRLTPVSASSRGPYCLMGVCFECLVMIDGIGNCQGCLIPVREGMRVERQIGPHVLSSAVPDEPERERA
jgi:D-hydroxyproline dehydrogenase subunit gamma